MSIHEGNWTEGTPCWVDLSAGDTDQARAFYSALFGWETEVGPPETGGYTMCRSDGHEAAGIGAKQPGMESLPSFWTTYLAADDVDDAARRVSANGGTIMAEPLDVMGFGRMAIGLDTNQAAFGLWQGLEMPGATIVNQPGGIAWNENMSRDFEGAKTFYTGVFDFGVQDMSGDGFLYAGLTIGGNAVAGVGALPDEVPAEVPAAWTTYFATADTDATVAKAVELGGSITREASDSPFGRMASLQGPEGEHFSIISVDDTTGDGSGE